MDIVKNVTMISNISKYQIYHQQVPTKHGTHLRWLLLSNALLAILDSVASHHQVMLKLQHQYMLTSWGRRHVLEGGAFSSSTAVRWVPHWHCRVNSFDWNAEWPWCRVSFFSGPCCPPGSVLHCPGERPAFAWINKDRWGTKVRWLTFPPHWVLTH